MYVCGCASVFCVYVCIYTLIERTPPPQGGFSVGWFPNQEPGGRGPPLKSRPPKLINFWGGSSGGVFFLRVLDQGT